MLDDNQFAGLVDKGYGLQIYQFVLIFFDFEEWVTIDVGLSS